MRKVIVSMNVTLDGFMASADNGLDWHFRYWNEEMADEASYQLSLADTILLGRKTYEAMAAWWPVQMINPDCPRTDIAYAEMMNRYRKIVFSRSLPTAHWNNSMLVHGGIEKEIASLKKLPGRNIITFGSGSVVTALMDAQLTDEYQVWVHPVVLGGGTPFVLDNKMVRLVDEKKFSSGVVLLFYQSQKTLCWK